MSSDRPLPPRRPPPIIKPPPAPRCPGALMDSLLQDQGETRLRGSSRQEAESPTPRAAPPTPLLPDTSTSTLSSTLSSTPLTDRITGRFPCKPARTCYKNPLLTLLQSDTRFSAPPPISPMSQRLPSEPERFSGEPVTSSLTPTRGDRRRLDVVHSVHV